MTGTPLAATDLSREILDKALGKQYREPDPERPRRLGYNPSESPSHLDNVGTI